MSAVTSEIKGKAQRAASSRPAEWLARAGLATRGVLYLLTALIVIELLTSRGTTGDQASNTGALEALVNRPFGRVLLIVVIIGIAGYALWRFSEAIRAPDASAAKRAANVGRGLTYVFLFVTAIQVLMSDSQSGGGQAQQGQSQNQKVDTVFDWPGGRWLIGLLGAVVIGLGLYNLYRAISGKWAKHLELERLRSGGRRAVEVIAWVGLLGRTFVFSLVGWFLIRAAVRYDPNEPVGLDQSLRTLIDESWGPVLLVLAAIGLVGYGLFSFVEARYRELEGV
jgi:hypothetical protein